MNTRTRVIAISCRADTRGVSTTAAAAERDWASAVFVPHAVEATAATLPSMTIKIRSASERATFCIVPLTVATGVST